MSATENATAEYPSAPSEDAAEQAPPVQSDPRLLLAVDIARAAAADEAGAEDVGEHVGSEPEDGAVTHLFAAEVTGYRGWRWAVTVAHGGDEETPVTVSEVVLLPGPDALVGRAWVPWSERVQAGDLGVGDVVLTPADDERLVPGYLDSGDSVVDEVNDELGLGRPRVLSREGRLDAAQRWKGGEFGPRSDMARGASGNCGTCGFYVQLGGSLRAAFGACGNEISPADGRVVHAEYGCGAHSEAEVDTSPAVPVAGLVYDDAQLDVVQTEQTTESTSDGVAERDADSVAATEEQQPTDTAEPASATVEAVVTDAPTTDAPEADALPTEVPEAVVAEPEAPDVAGTETPEVAEDTEPAEPEAVTPETVVAEEEAPAEDATAEDAAGEPDLPPTER